MLGGIPSPEIRMSPLDIFDADHEDGWLYHGTSQARLPGIRREGLTPQEKTRWARDVGIGQHGVGRVFFAERLSKGCFYAREASKTRPALLRVRQDALPDMRPDPKEERCWYVERPVPVGHAEIWNGGAWRPLAAPKRAEGKDRGDAAPPTAFRR